MTPKRVEAFLKEYDRRWRERTPASKPDHVSPYTRVTWQEMYRWFEFMFGRPVLLVERTQLSEAVRPLRDRLRAEFPDEAWEEER